MDISIIAPAMQEILTPSMSASQQANEILLSMLVLTKYFIYYSVIVE